jgi:CMP-N-acetylneuraminic acid synthetase
MEPFVEGIRIENYMRRQLLPPAYRLNGAVDVTWRSTILEKKILYAGVIEAHIMPVNRSIDIDTMLDFQLLEAIISQGEYE